MIRATHVGWKARRALAGTTAPPTVIAPLSRSLYLDVAGDLVWLGPTGSTLHARAVLADDWPAAEPGAVLGTPIDVGGASEWRPRPASGAAATTTIAAGCRALVAAVERVGAAEGFGALLTGCGAAFPLDRATPAARAFLAACAGDDANTAGALGERLLGLGPGLTPAGDDLVGGAFFARRWLVGLGPADAGWERASATLRSAAGGRTNRISAALLGDLLDGEAYAPLHDLAAALAAGASVDVTLDAARRLTRIGHSSGWDMLTGFLGGLSPLPHDAA